MSDQPLTRPEVEALQRQLSLLSESAVRDTYVRAHAQCCLGRGGLPSPAETQPILECLESSVAMGAERETEEMTRRHREAIHITIQ